MKRVLSIFSCLGIVASPLLCSSLALALEPSEIYAKAKEFTVQINGEETGTGTIIKNNNDIYTVLTCWHVMDTPGSYQITTADGSTHQVGTIENLPDVDLAIITFSSSNPYPVAELGDSATATSGFSAYVAGYRDPFPGASKRSYFTDSAEIQSRLSSAKKGYQIVHSGSFTPGSSGGGMFDSEARLVAVNGQFISEGNTRKAYGTGIPSEIYLATKNNFAVPNNVTAPQDFVSVGKRKLKQEDYQGAIAEFDKALVANPNDVNSLYNRAVVNLELENFDAAISDVGRVIELNPNNAVAYYYRGRSYDYLKDYQSAITNYDEAIRLNAEFAIAYHSRGTGYYYLKDYQSAIADYDEAIRLNPELAIAYNDRGMSYGSLEDYESAIADYDEAIRLNPEFAATTYHNRGTGYYYLKDYQSAITNYDEAIRLDPNYAVAYYNRGSSYHELEDYESAIANYNEAIRLNPNDAANDAVAYYYLGNSYSELKYYESAIANYNEVIRLAPTYADVYNDRALIYKNLGNNSLAIKDFKQAAELYRQKGNTEGYQDALNQIEQLDADNI